MSTLCPTCQQPTTQKWVFDLSSGEFSANGKTVRFTPRELQVFGSILRANGGTIKLENIHGYGYRVKP